MRAISTVLDVSLCLLLVTASALTLVGTPLASESDPDTADEIAEVLTTTTAQVTYAIGNQNRTAHDTLAGLLAAAALAGRESSPDSDSASDPATAFRRAVTRSVNRTLARHVGASLGVQVVADPAGESDSATKVVAGEVPPPRSDLHVASLTLPSGQTEGQVRLTVRTWSQ